MNIEELYDKFSVTGGVNTDSRSILPDEMFFALKGENFNGNKYADDALLKGALYAVVDEEEYATSSQHLLVDDTLKVLQELANFHRKMLDVPILAITGSNGKTTTKELIHAVLSSTFSTYATKGNLNNHIGVPLSLLRMNSTHQIGIIEMGANHMGEIAALCRIAEPNFGLITNIGTAHIEGFGSQQNIQKGKSELYDYIRDHKRSGVFVNSEDALLLSLSEDLNQITYGTSSDFFSGRIEGNPLTLKLTIDDQEQEFTIRTNLFGEYNFYNALAAGAVGKHFGVPLVDIAEEIEQYKPQNHRSQILKKNDITYIVDAYNANLSSMKAALKQFEKIKANKLAILGSMLELGDMEQEAHREIVSLVKEKNIDAYFVGQEFQRFSPKGKWFEKVEDLKKFLDKASLKGKTVLLKGSRGIRLENILS